MFWEKIRGDPRTVISMIFVACVVVTLIACIAFLMYGLL